MSPTWIVSANAAHAIIFSQSQAAGALQEVEAMANPAARLRESDLETDGIDPRSASKSRHNVGMSTQPNGYQPNQTPVEHEVEKVARHIAEYLKRAHHEGRYRELCLVASPEFLGELRGVLDDKLPVKLAIDKDYTKVDARELAERISKHRH